MNEEACVVCGEKLAVGKKDWHFFCPSCDYEQARLKPSINVPGAHDLVDETVREQGLRTLRQLNFTILLDELKRLLPRKGKRLLDVGAAYGWFLGVVAEHFDVLGVEPDAAVFSICHKRGHPVRQGYFPDALHEGEKFDVIVFNDVFEHIPDVRRILTHCHERLNENGLLLLNIPNSGGIFYRLAKILVGMGNGALFERLWQKDLPSPHLHYFRRGNLNQLAAQSGFLEVASGSLPSVRAEGLYERVACVTSHSRLFCCVVAFILYLTVPILDILPKDTIYSIYIKQARRADPQPSV